MPAKRKRSTRKYKRPYKKRRTARGSRRFNRPYPDGMQFDGVPYSVLRTRSLSAVPRKMNVKLKYFDNSTYSTAFQLTSHQFRLNSIWDPDLTFVGLLPMGYDQWSAFYSRYRVTGAKVDCTFINNATGAAGGAVNGSVPRLCLLYPGVTTYVPSDIKDMIEAPQVSYDYVSQLSGESIKKVSMYIPLHVLYGITKEQYMAEDNYAADMGANPVSAAYITVITDSVNETSTKVDISVHTTITYYVELTEPKNL